MAENPEGGDQQPFFDYAFYDEAPYADTSDQTFYGQHASDILPTEIAVGTDIEHAYLEDVYTTLGFSDRPTSGQLHELWTHIAPDDRMQRTYVIEALRGHSIGFHTMADLPPATYTTLIWGGDFRDVVNDFEDEQAKKNIPPHESYDGIYND